MSKIELDDNLILRMAGGDGNAFGEFYDRTSAAVYGFALSILRNKEDAEDLMHDTYIRAYSGAVSYTPQGKPMAWLLTIVRNLCYNKLRAGTMSEDLADYEDPAGLDEFDATLDRIVLEKAMQILSFEERQIVMLHSLTGLKHREIAELLEIPLGTVVSKYNRSLKKIRRELEEEERGKEGSDHA